MNNLIKLDWNSDYIDAHRRGLSDIQWARMQPEGKPKYSIGDIVEFMVGGMGKIDYVSEEHNGWPVSYSTKEIEGKEFHPRQKVAWHYEGDFKILNN